MPPQNLCHNGTRFYFIFDPMSIPSDEKPIGYFLVRTTRVVKLAFHHAFNQLGVDLTPEQWVILEQLYHTNDQSQKDLADDSFKNAPTISRIIDVLCKKGWTERIKGKKDKRVIYVHLTKDGKNIVESVIDRVEGIRAKGWDNLSKADYKTILRILNQIFDNYNIDDY